MQWYFFEIHRQPVNTFSHLVAFKRGTAHGSSRARFTFSSAQHNGNARVQQWQTGATTFLTWIGHIAARRRYLERFDVCKTFRVPSSNAIIANEKTKKKKGNALTSYGNKFQCDSNAVYASNDVNNRRHDESIKLCINSSSCLADVTGIALRIRLFVFSKKSYQHIIFKSHSSTQR